MNFDPTLAITFRLASVLPARSSLYRANVPIHRESCLRPNPISLLGAFHTELVNKGIWYTHKFQFRRAFHKLKTTCYQSLLSTACSQMFYKSEILKYNPYFSNSFKDLTNFGFALNATLNFVFAKAMGIN